MLNKTRKLNQAIIGTILLTLLVSSFAQAVLISPGLVFKAGNITYGVSTPINFDNITLGPTWLNLNGLGLNFTSTNNLYINFSFYRNYPTHTSAADTVFFFNASTVLGTHCIFNISGLKPSTAYTILNGSAYLARTSDILGHLQWINNSMKTNTMISLSQGTLTPPVLTITPTNGSTGINPKSTVAVTATNPGYLVTVRFYENTTGGMVLRQTNANLASGSTVYWTYSNAKAYLKEYWFKVVTNNTAVPNGWTNKTYHFTTRASLPVVISSETPANNTIHTLLSLTSLTVNIIDPDGDLIDWTITNNATPPIGVAGAIGDTNGTKTCSISGLHYNTSYWWAVTASDTAGSGTIITDIYKFTTIGSMPVIISSPYPANNTINVSIFLGHLNITLNDPEGDGIGWVITTTPDIGLNSSMSLTDHNGSKVCWIHGLSYSTTYSWTIMAVDNGSHIPVSRTYYFTTMAAPYGTGPGAASETIIVYIMPTIIAVALIMVLLVMLYSGALTVESFVMWLILFLIAMIAIFVIYGITI